MRYIYYNEIGIFYVIVDMEKSFSLLESNMVVIFGQIVSQKEGR